MLVKDIMTSPAISIPSQAQVSNAVRLMLDRGVSGLPVLSDGGRLVGIVSEADFLHRSEIGTGERRRRWLTWLINPEALADDYARSNGLYVREIMSPTVVTVESNARLEEAVRLMERHRVKRLPVLDGEILVGVLTRFDLIKALSSLLAPAYEEPATSDQEIRSRIEAELESQSWAPVASIVVKVKDGVVQLCGSIFNDGQRRAIRVAAEKVSGVREVHDHMCFVEPMTGIVLPSPEDEEKRARG